MLLAFVAWLLMDALIVLMCWYMPVSRAEEAFFGVRVSSEFYRDHGHRLLLQYRLWLGLTFLQIEVLGALVTIFRGEIGLARIIGVFLLLFANSALYVVFARQIKPFALVEENQRYAAPLITRHLADYTNLAVEIAILIALIGPFLALVYFYPQLPEWIPVHWNWKGEVDNWARKSFTSVFAIPVLTLYMHGLLFLVKRGLLGVKMTLPGEHAAEYLELKERQLNLNLNLMDWMRALTSVVLGAIALNTVFSSLPEFASYARLVNIVLFSITGVMFVIGFWYLFQMIGVNRDLKTRVGRVYVQRPSDAEHWYGGGTIYYNPEDPAFFVEKLVGWGYTVNFAHREAQFLMGYTLLMPVLALWLIFGSKSN
ncbi:MAG TPA: DUF1648 domain-containing protein [Acidobacteriota bacterium]|nr:DUF1648 domain-containing protein [Acidobacteriota bacterium]